MSYVASFEPWQWVIGTRIYVNDVNELVAEKKRSLIIVLSILIFITVLAVVFMLIKVLLIQYKN